MTIETDMLWDEFADLDANYRDNPTAENADAISELIKEHGEGAWFDKPGDVFVSDFSFFFWTQFDKHVKVNWIFLEILEDFPEDYVTQYIETVFPSLSHDQRVMTLLRTRFSAHDIQDEEKREVYLDAVHRVVLESWYKIDAEDNRKYPHYPFKVVVPSFFEGFVSSRLFEQAQAVLPVKFWTDVAESLFELPKSRWEAGRHFAGIYIRIMKFLPDEYRQAVITTILGDCEEHVAETFFISVAEHPDLGHVPAEWMMELYWYPYQKKQRIS